MDKYEHCKKILESDESDYDDGDSEFGIVNEEDNLFENNIYGCEIQLFSQSHHRGEPVNFKVGKWKKLTIKSLRVSGFCCFRIKWVFKDSYFSSKCLDYYLGSDN